MNKNLKKIFSDQIKFVVRRREYGIKCFSAEKFVISSYCPTFIVMTSNSATTFLYVFKYLNDWQLDSCHDLGQPMKIFENGNLGKFIYGRKSSWVQVCNLFLNALGRQERVTAV